MKRLILHINGAVQGVGFRPFIYKIARELGLKGYVLNDTSGVTIEVEGDIEELHSFILRLNTEKPSLASIFSIETTYAGPAGFNVFEIRESKGRGRKEALILPDIATCDLCLAELFDINNRRYLYPFINCTNCGPRYTIINRLPYDRINTTMKAFVMCPECRKEYDNPLDRRFHAEPNACPSCGPHMSLYESRGRLIAEKEAAMTVLEGLIKEGAIIALKGLGGFHLICDARNEHSIALLRERKRREEKPFAVMFRDLAMLREYAEPSTLEEALLLSPEKPIVLVGKKESALSQEVSPGLRRIGAFLPYSPLHHILLRDLGFPLIATSGNISEEPIIKDNEEAFAKLTVLADFIMLHDRPIKQRCDDSVLKVTGGLPAFLRRSRGYAPMPVRLPFKLRNRVLAVGGFYKNTFALGFDDKVILSQHIGDLDTEAAVWHFEAVVKELCALYDFTPELIVHDLHPGYATTRWALAQAGVEKTGIQHHFAHIIACMAENEIETEVMGVAWDGTGYGSDGTLWGGEFLKCSYEGYERLAHFKPLRLPGGEKAIREPRRMALSILFEIFGKDCFSLEVQALKSFKKKELEILFAAWEKGINSPYSSSAGRLFDAVASIMGLKQILNYEGQAAMMLEDLYDPGITDSYPFELKDRIIDWTELFSSILKETKKEKIPSRFINTLAEIVLRVAEEAGIGNICLSGGVFQNDPLTKRVSSLLSREFKVYTHKKVPANDGGISLGQAVYGGLLDRK